MLHLLYLSDPLLHMYHPFTKPTTVERMRTSTSPDVKERPMFQLVSLSLFLRNLSFPFARSCFPSVERSQLHSFHHPRDDIILVLEKPLLVACPFFALGPRRHSSVPHNYLCCVAFTHVSTSFQLPDPLTSLAQVCFSTTYPSCGSSQLCRHHICNHTEFEPFFQIETESTWKDWMRTSRRFLLLSLFKLSRAPVFTSE